jgi:glycosyltransferase involved in cell wall biosynthesis
MLLLGGIRYDSRVLKEARSLIDAGIDLTVITAPFEPESVSELPGARIKQLLMKTRRWFSRGSATPIKFVEFGIRATFSAIRVRADVYHAHDLTTLIPAYLAARATGGRLVYDAHELWTEQFPGSRRGDGTTRWLERQLLRRCDEVIVPNHLRAEVIKSDYGFGRDPMVLYNCPDLRRMNSTSDKPLRKYLESAGVDPGSIIVLAQGALRPGLYLEELIISVSDWPSNAVLVVLGPGSSDYSRSLESLAGKTGRPLSIIFHPAVPNDDLAAYTSDADMGIVFYRGNSRNNLMCAPNKLHDFMASSVPVVAHDLPGIREVMDREGVSEMGVVIDASDPAAISEAISILTSDADARTEMAENGFNAAHALFNWEIQEGTLLKSYRRLVTGPEPK